MFQLNQISVYIVVQIRALFPSPPPTSLNHEFYGLTIGFTRLIMKTKYVSHNLVSLHVKFHDKLGYEKHIWSS